MIFIGIDPGRSGGIALIDESIGEIRVMQMPMLGHEIDTVTFKDFIYSTSPSRLTAHHSMLAGIEKVGAMPKQGVTSMFNFGFSTGMIHGMLATLHIQRKIVTPQAWKKEILVGTAKDKEAAIEYCAATYPSISLIPTGCRKPQDGMADALCIAEYIQRMY